MFIKTKTRKTFVPFFNIRNIGAINTNNTLGIVSIVHNQAAYIEDWIKFHYIAGVKDFYFYIDNCTDDTLAIINNMSKLRGGVNITTIPWTILSKKPKHRHYFDQQILSYVHAIYNFGHNHEWMAFTDTDEYLVPIGKKTIVDAISHLRKYSNISLQYTLFGSNGHKTKPPVGDIFAYTNKVKGDLPELYNFLNTKCTIKPFQVNSVNIHRFITNDMGKYTVNDIGKLIKNTILNRKHPGFISNTNIQLNHYYIRSEEELNTKINWYKNWSKSNHNAEKLKRAQVLFDTNAIEDTSIKDFLSLHGIENYDQFRNF